MLQAIAVTRIHAELIEGEADMEVLTWLQSSISSEGFNQNLISHSDRGT